MKYDDMISTLKMIPPNGEPNAADIPAALAIEIISILLELEDPYLWRYTGRRIKSFAMHAARCTCICSNDISDCEWLEHYYVQTVPLSRSAIHCYWLRWLKRFSPTVPSKRESDEFVFPRELIWVEVSQILMQRDHVCLWPVFSSVGISNSWVIEISTYQVSWDTQNGTPDCEHQPSPQKLVRVRKINIAASTWRWIISTLDLISRNTCNFPSQIKDKIDTRIQPANPNRRNYSDEENQRERQRKMPRPRHPRPPFLL